MLVLVNVPFALSTHARQTSTHASSTLRASPGLAALVVVAGLLALSSDAALRKLKAKNWKRLQRLNYVLFALVIVHAFFYGALAGDVPVHDPARPDRRHRPRRTVARYLAVSAEVLP